MKERYGVSDFSLGIIKRMDAEDIPYNAASDSTNIDGDAPEGQLMGIPTSVTKSSTLGTASRLFEWIKTLDSKWHLVHVTGTGSPTISVLNNFYGTPVDSGIAVVGSATSMVRHNEEVHIAIGNDGWATPSAPNWTGYCNYGQFGGSVLEWKSVTAVIPRPTWTANFSIAGTANAGTMVFDVNLRYEYTGSFVYDGTQESPIGYAGYTFTPTSEYNYLTLTITMASVASLNPRVTGFKLYRRTVNLTTGDTTLWRLQNEINVTTSVGYVDRTGSNISWVTSGADKTITYVDNNTDVLSSYEEQSGIPETLTTSDVNYTLNTDLNAFHFVAGCSKTGLPDASMMMFRSKQYRYDTFDWTNDFLKLPTTPTALKSFNGKIWAFDLNNTYKINPDGMYIEEVIPGVGCLSQRSISVTPYGTFWCDTKNAYWYNGGNITPIGDAIRADFNSSTQWHNFNFNYTVGYQGLTPIVLFHAPKNYILFIIPYHAVSGGVSNVWAYHVQKQRWDKWTSFTVCPDTTIGFGAFSGRSGEIYVSDGTNLVEPLGHATNKRTWDWTSQIIPFGKLAQLKRFYKLNSDNTSLTAAPVFTYGKDRATPTSSLTSGEFKSGGVYEQGKLLQLKITEGTAYNNIVYSFEILFRRLLEL